MNLPTCATEVHAALADAYNSGKVETVLSLYDYNGLFVPDSGQPLSGKKHFEETIASILAIKGKMEIKTVYCVQTGNVAVGRSEWSIADGQEVKVSAKGIEVMQQQADGTW